MTVRLMGNCSRCYYATDKNADGGCACARYPRRFLVLNRDQHFCGEYVSEYAVAKRTVKVEEHGA